MEAGEPITDLRASLDAYKPPEAGPHDPSVPTEMTIHFYANGHAQRTPYIERLIGYENDGSEGCIHFDGYYYVYDGSEEDYVKESEQYEENRLPKRLLMDVIVQETEPYHTYRGRSWFRIVSHDQFDVEFYRREKIKCTDVISEIEDEDGEPMSVCFFPTNEQRLYFRVKNGANSRNGCCP